MGNYISKITLHTFNNQILPEPNKKIINVPTYYTNESPIHIDYIYANNSWKLITENNDNVRANIYDKKNINISCINLFYETFYDKLFQIFPDVKIMFKKNIHNQGKMLVYMISSLLESFYDLEINNKINQLIERHIEFGVKSYYFYIVGDILLYSFYEVLLDYFTVDYYNAWKKIYSSMLRIIIPIIKKYEEDHMINEILNQYSYHYLVKDNIGNVHKKGEKEEEKCIRIKEKIEKKDKDVSKIIEEHTCPPKNKNRNASSVSDDSILGNLTFMRTYVYQTNKKNVLRISSKKKKSQHSSKLICTPKDIFSPNISYIEPTII